MRKVSYTVTEDGNKSVDVRETIQLSATAANGRILNYTTDNPMFELYDVAYPENGTLPTTAHPIISGDGKRVVDKDGKKYSITYHMDPYVLSGNKDKGEAEADGNSNVKQHDYTLSFSPSADNRWQGATVKMEILVEGKQHRNTDGKWDEISKETYIFSNGDKQSVVPRIPEKVATLVDGPTFNKRVRNLAGGNDLDMDALNKVTSIEWSTPPASANSSTTSSSATASVDMLSSPASLFVDQVYAVSDQDHIVSAPNSPCEIRADLVDGTLYLQTDAKKIYTNADMSNMFQYMAVSKVPFDKEHNVDMSLTTNMANAFEDHVGTTLDLSNWNTSNVTNMDGMFVACSSLTNLNVSGWDTSNVTDMGSMFMGCDTITTLDIGGWNTSNVVEMGCMFEYCSALATLNISGWDTGKVTDMADMFGYCTALATLDVSGWNTSNVVETGCMFEYCSALTTLNISGWDTGKVTGADKMFYMCSSLAKIIVGSKSLSLPSATVASDIFEYCDALPNFDDSKIGASMWKPISEGGYLTVAA